MGNLACVTHGSAIVYPNDGFDPLLVLETVQAERCTGLHGVPTMFIAELDHPRFKEFDLSTLRTGIMAGSPCPIEVMKRVVSDMHLSEITIAYGMTETQPCQLPERCRHAASAPRVHRGQGAAAPGGEDRRSGHGRGRGARRLGRAVHARLLGDARVLGDRARRRAKAIDDEAWMHTGDLATMDEQGYVNIVGRIKDMVIRGGENIYPREIEEFLYHHLQVQDVQVVGVPTTRYGEERVRLDHRQAPARR